MDGMLVLMKLESKMNLKQNSTTHKVIAVFNVPDEYNVPISHLTAKLIANGYTIECLSITDDIKPMPNKSKCILLDEHPYSNAEIESYIHGLLVGRNRAINEILGEEE